MRKLDVLLKRTEIQIGLPALSALVLHSRFLSRVIHSQWAYFVIVDLVVLLQVGPGGERLVTVFALVRSVTSVQPLMPDQVAYLSLLRPRRLTWENDLGQ